MVDELFDYYIEAMAEDVRSRCAEEAVLCTHVLSLIATGFARETGEVLGFMDGTFYAYQGESRVR